MFLYLRAYKTGFFMNAEIEKRRTFAIVSHPDAGKTTITEKFLWYGNVIREAGHVRAKANHMLQHCGKRIVASATAFCRFAMMQVVRS